MRLMVTRPEPECAATAARLSALGHEVIAEPLLAIAYNPVELPEDPAAIILTSRNGVRALSRWPDHEKWLRRPVFAVGPGTGEAVSDLGFRDVRVAGGDAFSLLALITASFEPEAGQLFYPAPRDRAGPLPDALLSRGYDVFMVEAYRAELRTALSDGAFAAFQAGTVQGVMLYSRRTAQAFMAAVEAAGLCAALAGVQFFVISEQVAAVVRSAGGKVHVAFQPDEESMLALVSPFVRS